MNSPPDRFTGSGPDPVPDGGIVTVAFHDPDRAGQVITVTATDGDDPTARQEFSVKLRGNGKGSALFIVPVGWVAAVLTAEGSHEHRVDVALPP